MKVPKDIDVRHSAHITFECGASDFQLIQNNALQTLDEKNSLYVIEESGVLSYPDSCILDV